MEFTSEGEWDLQRLSRRNRRYAVVLRTANTANNKCETLKNNKSQEATRFAA